MNLINFQDWERRWGGPPPKLPKGVGRWLIALGAVVVLFIVATVANQTAGANLGYYSQRNVGPINAIMQTTPDKARAAVRALYNEIAHMNDPDYFTDGELENAKALLEADDLYQREKLSSYTHVIGFWWSSAGLDYFRGYLKRLRAT